MVKDEVRIMKDGWMADGGGTVYIENAKSKKESVFESNWSRSSDEVAKPISTKIDLGE